MEASNVATCTPESKTVLKRRQRRKESIKKWSHPVCKAGFTIIPTLLLTKQDELGLDPVDINILLQLAAHWWKADKPPFLAKGTLGRRLGRDASTIRRHVASLEKRGFLKRIDRIDDARGRRSNHYDLHPLIDILHPLAIEAIKAKKNKKEGQR